MTKNEVDFESWFDTLRLDVGERTGVNFTDQDSVRDDYEQGRDVHEVADEIVDEYNT